MKNIIQLVVLTLTLSIGAFAQFDTTVDGNEAPELFSLSGDQTNEGNYAPALNQMVGNTFTLEGSSNSYESALLTISFDYDGEADFINGNNINGGTWNLAVYSKGGYVGSVYGEVVAGGRITWTMDENSVPEDFSGNRTTVSDLQISGGTGIFENASPEIANFQAQTDVATGVTVASIKGISAR